MRIIFPHIPKCAGSTIRQQLENREDVYFDYFNHPTWMSEIDKLEGSIKQNQLKAKLASIENWIVFGHFSSATYDDIPYDWKIILLRQPLERAISHFYYVKDILTDSNFSRRRHKEVPAIKNGSMGLSEFLELEHIKFFYLNFYLKNLVINEKTIILPTEKINESFNIIYRLTGISLNSEIHINKSLYSDQIIEEISGDYLIEDSGFYNKLVDLYGIA